MQVEMESLEEQAKSSSGDHELKDVALARTPLGGLTTLWELWASGNGIAEASDVLRGRLLFSSDRLPVGDYDDMSAQH